MSEAPSDFEELVIRFSGLTVSVRSPQVSDTQSQSSFELVEAPKSRPSPGALAGGSQDPAGGPCDFPV